MVTSRKRRAISSRGVRLQPRDVFVLEQAVRFHAFTVPLLRETLYHGLGRSTVYESIRRLVRAGLFEDLTTGPSNRLRPGDVPALYVPTPLAYALLGSPLRARPVRPELARHTLAVAQVGLRAVLAHEAVVTDREMHFERQQWRNSRQTRTPLAAAWMGNDEDFWIPGLPAWESVSPDLDTHVPDLVITGHDGEVHAIEVELSRKNTRELTMVLKRYGRTRKYDAVIYYAETKTMAERIKKVTEALPPADRPPTLVIRRLVPEWQERRKAA